MKRIQTMLSGSILCLLSFIMLFSGSIRGYAYEAVNAQIPVNCFYVSDENEHLYQVKIEAETFGAPLPESDTLWLGEGETGCFDISITEPGTFVYRLYEIPGDDPNIQYDSEVYHISLFVENAADGSLNYAFSAAVDGKGSKSREIEFQQVDLSGAGSRTRESATSASASQTSVTTLTETTAQSATVTSDESVSRILHGVFTGDSFPAHAVRLAILFAVIAFLAFLFRRKHREGEERNA